MARRLDVWLNCAATMTYGPFSPVRFTFPTLTLSWQGQSRERRGVEREGPVDLVVAAEAPTHSLLRLPD